jgi:hypothetical protein
VLPGFRVFELYLTVLDEVTYLHYGCLKTPKTTERVHLSCQVHVSQLFVVLVITQVRAWRRHDGLLRANFLSELIEVQNRGKQFQDVGCTVDGALYDDIQASAGFICRVVGRL